MKRIHQKLTNFIGIHEVAAIHKEVQVTYEEGVSKIIARESLVHKQLYISREMNLCTQVQKGFLT